MTAVNVFAQPKAGAAWIVSDGAFTTAEGRVASIRPKVIDGGRAAWALGVTGNVDPETLAEALGTPLPHNLAQLERRLAGAMRRAIAKEGAACGLPPGMVVCGVNGCAWDYRRRRPIAFLMHSCAGLLPAHTVEPFTWYETSWVFSSGHPHGIAGLLGRDVDPSDPLTFSADSDGLALVAAQRRHGSTIAMPGLDSSITHRIGGAVFITKVEKDGARTWRAHDFPDAVGAFIGPFDSGNSKESR